MEGENQACKVLDKARVKTEDKVRNMCINKPANCAVKCMLLEKRGLSMFQLLNHHLLDTFADHPLEKVINMSYCTSVLDHILLRRQP